MVHIQRLPGFNSRVDDYQEYIERTEELHIKSYEDYLAKGHEWCWCLVGNVVKEHEFGEDKEIRQGTKCLIVNNVDTKMNELAIKAA